MIKIRGPFDSQDAAQAWVDSVAGQNVPFKGFERRELPATGLDRLRPRREVVFAVFDDPEADWPDEEIVFDESLQRWTARH